MQTFLCEPTFSLSLAHLDYKRLGKQRVEAYQILLALGDEWAWSVYKGSKTPDNIGWKNHPAVLMWKDYEQSLRWYYGYALKEWILRDYKNNMLLPVVETGLIIPVWLTQNFITSHRCKLLQKNYEFYSRYNWDVPSNWKDVEYIWPVRKG